MLSLYLTLQLLAGFPGFHHWLHHDSGSPDHQCVIKLVASGELLAGPPETFELRPDYLPEFVPMASLPAVVGVDLVLPPGRAPPASPA